MLLGKILTLLILSQITLCVHLPDRFVAIATVLDAEGFVLFLSGKHAEHENASLVFQVRMGQQ